MRLLIDIFLKFLGFWVFEEFFGEDKVGKVVGFFEEFFTEVDSV